MDPDTSCDNDAAGSVSTPVVTEENLLVLALDTAIENEPLSLGEASGNEIASNVAGEAEANIEAGENLEATDAPDNDEQSPSLNSRPEEYTTGQQTRIVTQLIKTIGRLRQENTLLEMQISDSDKHNRILQLQIDIMMKKMELLEGFMTQVKKMDQDAELGKETGQISNKTGEPICHRCKNRIDASPKANIVQNESDDESEVDVKEVLRSVGWSLDNDLGEDETRDDQEKNPLLIDIVVGHVLSYLPTSTLKKCRFVNHLWYQEATYILRSKQSLTINRDNIDKMPDFMRTLESTFSPGNPFIFRSVKVEINFLVKTYRDYLLQFFTDYGREITSFSMSCDQENSAILYTEEVRNIFMPYIVNVQQLELSLPTKITDRQTMYDDIRPKPFVFNNLTVLKIRQMDVSLDIGGYTVPWVKELLRTTSSLKSLFLETHTKEVISRVLLALNDKDCRQSVQQLEELYLDGFILEEHLNALITLDVRLKVLQLSYITVNVSPVMIEAVLTKHRTTLKTLILGDFQKRTTSNSLPMVIRLPVLRELRSLKFVDPLFPDQRQILLNPLNYSEQLPVLNEICFEHDTGKPTGPHYFQDVFVCSPSVCTSLTGMKISHGLTEAHLVASAAKMFPNLTRLELSNAPDCVIQAVWRDFTGLKSVHLGLSPANLNIDSLLTGIPDQVCRRIQEKNLFSQVDLMNALDIIRVESAITNLSELETLRIDGYSSSLLTAVTGYLAFCRMKSLSNISIKSDIITLSRECRRVLGETLHLSLLEFF